MRNATHYESGVVEVGPGDTICRIVDQMSYYAVGCVVVVDEARRPVGIVTDRDLLRRVIRVGRDPEKTRAADVMTPNPVTGGTDEPLERLLEKMKSVGARRLPIVREGQVVGLVALDDIIAEIGKELGDIRAALRDEVLGARRAAQSRRWRNDITATIEELRAQVTHLGADSMDWIQREIEAMRRRLGGRD
jgi:CBS domain-containing protein